MADESQRGQQRATSGTVEGKYANHFQIGHNAFEFVLDFGQLFADDAAERFHTRIVTSPRHAKEVLTLLRESINEYECSFGSIEMELQK
jgi:hypothetical protein